MKVTRTLIASVLAFCTISTANAGTIDLFHTPHAAETDVTTPPPQGVGSVANPAATAIGGERDLFVNKTGGADGERLRARVNPLGATKLRIDADAEVLGSVYVTWDGADADANPFTGIDFDGLGGIDLTAGADSIELVATFSDVGGPVHFSIYDNAANSAAAVATASLALPGGIPPNTPTSLMLPFSSFSGTTSALSNAGAILMEVENATGAWDLNILSVKTVPEPASVALLAMGMLLTIGSRRKRH